MTLLPLGAEELRSIGYQAIAGAGHGAGAGGRGSLAPALGPGTAPATNGGHRRRPMRHHHHTNNFCAP